MRYPMRARSLPILALIIVAIAACGGDTTGPGGGGAPVFGGIGGLNGGFSGKSGFTGFNHNLDSQFTYLYRSEFFSEGPWNCTTDGHCGVAGLRRDFGTLTEPDTFLFVTTTNVDFNFVSNVVVRNSGVQTRTLTIANNAQYSSVRVAFEFVFATARLNSATHNDSAIVRIKAGNDSATIFKVTTADIQAAKFPLRTGGCGVVSLMPGRPVTYPTCTQWVATTGDITAFKGRSFVLQFIVGEGSQSPTDQVDQPSTLLFRKVTFEGAK